VKVLNLYAGIGGNRKLWKNVEVTAVEIKSEIAKIYQEFFPDDIVVIGDAHKYLLQHYKGGWDFIWSSPPCPSHSGINWFANPQGVVRYPDIKLYEEILFLRSWFKGLWVVENVVPYYEPLIQGKKVGRHYFWSNFVISDIDVKYQIGTMNRQASKNTQRKAIIREAQIPELIDLNGLKDFKLSNKRQVLRNCVKPEIGKHVFDCAFKIKQVDFGNFDNEFPKILEKSKKIKKSIEDSMKVDSRTLNEVFYGKT